MGLKLTPGPWMVRIYNGKITVVTQQDVLVTEVRTLAEAHLIASAPQMLAMLKRVYADCAYFTVLDWLWPGLKADILDLISKAEGNDNETVTII